MSASTTPTLPANLFGLPRGIVIPRDGDRDLAFKGWRLSYVKDCQRFGDGSGTFNRCTEVSIHLTEGKRLVTHVHRWNERGGGVEREEHVVGVHGRDPLGRTVPLAKAVKEAIEWLKKDNGGQLGGLSKRAWLEACRLWPELKGEEFEHVD